MMSFCWYSAALFLLTPDLLPTHLLLLQAVPTSSPVTLPKIQYNIDVGFDYDYDKEDSSYSPPNQSNNTSAPMPALKQSKPCEYHPCRGNQAPCSQLSTQTGCLCPKLTGEDMPPKPPLLQKLVSSRDGNIKIQWCAPASVVSAYQVVIEHKNNFKLLLGPELRRVVIGKLKAGDKVCVKAINKAGNSPLSCQRYNSSVPPEAPNLAPRVGVIERGLVLLFSLTALIL